MKTLQPASTKQLEHQIEAIESEAYRGCGLFYELFAQRFTNLANTWLDSLADTTQQATALQLLEKHPDYFPEVQGRWNYDQEKNDIHWSGQDEQQQESAFNAAVREQDSGIKQS